jgi:ABC-type transport system substrate-binding protein
MPRRLLTAIVATIVFMASNNAILAAPALKFGDRAVLDGIPNPRKIGNAADWFASKHIWARLVDVGVDGQVQPYLARKFTRSHDGLTWTFDFPPNLKWSDGSPMTVQEIRESLNLTLKGTAHLGVGKYVKQVVVKGPQTIVFELNRLPANFLTSLAFADFSITDGEVNPERAAGALLKLRTSGPYRVKASQYGMVTLEPNSFFSGPSPLPRDFEIHGLAVGDAFFDSVKKEHFDVFYTTNNYLSPAMRAGFEKEGYKAFQGSPYDFTISLQFGQKGIDRLSPARRRWLYKKLWKALAKNTAFGGSAAIGVRPVGLFGALPEKDFLQSMEAIPDTWPKGEDDSPLEIFIVKSLVSSEMYQAIRNVFEKEKIPFKEVVYDLAHPDSPETKRRNAFDFDLYLIFQGVSDPDPDTMWHYLQSTYKPSLRFIPEKLLEDALFEQDTKHRQELYRAMERRHLDAPFLIPLQMIGGTIFVKAPLLPPEDGNFEWGVQLWKFREGK